MEVDDKTALMTRREFEDLPQYSCSLPTGQTIGKRWKRDLTAFSISRARALKEGKEPPAPEWIMGA